MNKLYTSLPGFLRSNLTRDSILRGIGVSVFSIGTALGVVYANYYNYWKGTIYRTQTVDFNLLANVLPTKLSIHLSKGDIKGLQKTLDSNYGLFGVVMTDCTSAERDCPGQKITHVSKVKVEESANSKWKLLPQNDYAELWTREFENEDFPQKLLRGELFVPLRNPPPLNQEWQFKTPYDSQRANTGQQNQGEIIGRVYFLRATPPSFLGELQRWLKEPLGNSSRTLVYNAIACSALFTGLFAWLVLELAYYRARLAQEKEALANLEVEKEKARTARVEAQAAIEKLEAEHKLRIAAESEAKAIQGKLEAEEAANISQRQAIEVEAKATEEKLEAEHRLRVAAEEREKAIQSQLEAEEIARIAAESEAKAIQEKLEAEEAANISQRQAIEAEAKAARERLENESRLRVAAEEREKAIEATLEAEEIALKALEREVEASRRQAEIEEQLRQYEESANDWESAIELLSSLGLSEGMDGFQHQLQKLQDIYEKLQTDIQKAEGQHNQIAEAYQKATANLSTQIPVTPQYICDALETFGYTQSFISDVEDIYRRNRVTFLALRGKLLEIEQNPQIAFYEALTDVSGHYEYRMGNFRLYFRRDNGERLILVRFGNRNKQRRIVNYLGKNFNEDVSWDSPFCAQRIE